MDQKASDKKYFSLRFKIEKSGTWIAREISIFIQSLIN